jgi:Rps23 Pro-64 3,4-dihydroxylase Tpa1-like proline 4-hydroxylase
LREKLSTEEVEDEDDK